MNWLKKKFLASGYPKLSYPLGTVVALKNGYTGTIKYIKILKKKRKRNVKKIVKFDSIKKKDKKIETKK